MHTTFFGWCQNRWGFSSNSETTMTSGTKPHFQNAGFVITQKMLFWWYPHITSASYSCRVWTEMCVYFSFVCGCFKSNHKRCARLRRQCCRCLIFGPPSLNKTSRFRFITLNLTNRIIQCMAWVFCFYSLTKIFLRNLLI